MPTENDLKQLRRNFHVTLAKKRGLRVNDKDLSSEDMAQNDGAIQKRLERVSFWRKLSLFAKNDN